MSDMIGRHFFRFRFRATFLFFRIKLITLFFPVNIIELIVNFNPCVPTLTKEDDTVQATLKSYLNT